MSEDLLATLITVVILAALVIWVPLLNLVCPPCARFVSRARRAPVTDRASSRVAQGGSALESPR